MLHSFCPSSVDLFKIEMLKEKAEPGRKSLALRVRRLLPKVVIERRKGVGIQMGTGASVGTAAIGVNYSASLSE